jgi:chromosome segregation protein
MPPRLKSLELHGYKTFASRTEFQFPGVVTAIVGPNGSGKSNVADALRWVLGEQSYSLLRGRKTEDMIFSGSEGRSRAGMASATIFFDNSDGWLPIDFSEVAITRRAYRDGQNEYLINNQRVRLREIAELLGRSGLAERTYTIIGQGLVDAALALKPEERRKLFEEAAGIGLYRSRREESISRLETTRRNLERVRDILVELEPRLRSLERQARRVQEHDRLQAELKLLLRDWYGFQWHRAQQEMTHLVELQRTQEARAERAREAHTTVTTELSIYRGQINELRSRLNEWHRQMAGLHELREKINRELAILDERQKAILDQRVSHTTDLGRLEEELAQRKSRLDEVTQEKQRMLEDLAEAERQQKSAGQALQEQQNRRAEAEKAVRALRQQQVSTETRQVQIKARQDELKHRATQLAQSLERAVKAMETGAAETARTQKALEIAIRKRQDAEAAREEVSDQVDLSKKRIDELDVQRRKLLDERNKLEAQQSRISAQLDVIEQAEKSLSGVAEGARIILQAVRQGKLGGRIQTISSLLDVPAEYETAIAAALGEFLDVLCLEPGADPEQVLQLLDSNEKGRAALLPIQWIADTGRNRCPSDPDCVGVAADLVTAPQEIRPAVDALLGHVLIVRDRPAARRLKETQEGFSRYVTMNGEVFHSSGLVYAGKETRGGALSRPRQKRELQATLEGLQEQEEKLSVELDRIQQSFARQVEDQRRLEKDYQAANRFYEQAHEQRQQAKLASDQAQRQLEWQTGQKSSLETQAAAAQKDMEQSAREISEIETKISSLRNEVRQANGVLASLPLDELQAQVAHWNTTQAVTARGIQEAQKRLEEHQQNIERNLAQQASYRERIQASEATLADLDDDRKCLYDQESTHHEKIAALQKTIDPEEAELERLEKSFGELQEDETQVQQALALAERMLTQSQMEVARQKESMENLHHRIEEDFGLVAFEYTEEMPSQAPLPIEGMVEELPVVTELPAGLEQEISRIRGQIRRMGAINPEAQAEYIEVNERYQFMTQQVTDLQKADQDLRQVIAELDELMRREFRKTFDAVAGEFKHLFTRLFGGGTARLTLIEGDNPTEPGIEIETKLPGRREQGLSLLSGGERSLTAVALVFSLLKVSPTPFCVMDEVDAMLDEANVGRFRDLLRELSQQTQFLVITHNRNTVQAADVIYGITMGRDSSSQVISLRLDELSEDMVK